MRTPGKGGYIGWVEDVYKSTYGLNDIITIKNTSEFTTTNQSNVDYNSVEITITDPNSKIRKIVYSGTTAGTETYKFEVVGTYTIKYNGQNSRTTAGQVFPATYTFTYNIAVVENKLPLKKWTITDVINRTLELAEPLRKGEKPRFRLNAEQAKQFDKILSPELSFTKQTLRECLQQVGGVIHGEPRLKPVKEFVEEEKRVAVKDEEFARGKVSIGSNNIAPYEQDKAYFVIIDGDRYDLKLDSEANGGDDDYYFEITELPFFFGITTVYTISKVKEQKWIYEVYYEMLAGNEKSGIEYLPYSNKGQQHIIEHYSGWLDCTAENLINVMDKFSGVVVEPYEGGVKSVRTENLYVRIEEGNMLIPTQYPIYTVEKLEYVYEADGQLKAVDITQYVFEKSEYDGRLSSYDGAYPYSKMYGLFFTQGGKNIAGLNFKVPDVTPDLPPYSEYAITNILRQVTGNDKLSLDYPKMCFRVTYTPFYNARVGQTKVNYKEFKYPAALIYNQQSNLIESRAYGENLKGAVARLGNTEVSLTYNLCMLYEVAKAGLKYNNKFYISAVATAIYPTLIRSTIGLSRDFNRLSQYIGVSSVKRYYEVSKSQAVARNTLYREFVVIGKRETSDDDTLTGKRMLEMIAALFSPPTNSLGPVTNVVAWGTSYSGETVQGGAVNLPVISSAFGNSISFSWSYEDNYSAGATSQYQKSTNVEGYFQQSLPYGDYYGRLYYYNFDLQFAGVTPTPQNYEKLGQSLPRGDIPAQSSEIVSTIGKTPYILRKDNREALQVNFQIDFVSNLDNIIIGSALASYCPAVRGTDPTLKPRLYVFPEELNKFTDHVEAFADVDLSSLPSVEVTAEVLANRNLVVTAGSFPSGGKAWAIVTAQRSVTETVEGEDGTQTEQTTYFGGDLIIGQNIEVEAGKEFTPVYFTLKREIFDKSVWKDIL